MKRRTGRIVTALLLSVMLLLGSTAAAASFGKGAQGPDVYAVQGMLKSLGYYTAANITGYYGTYTEEAVKRFQRKYGLKVTGVMDDQTLQSLLWAYGNAKISKQQVPAPTPKPVPVPQPTPVPTPPPAPPEQPGIPEQPNVPNQPPAAGLTAEEQQMLDLVNAERQKAGLSPLQADMAIVQTARLKSQDMVDKNYFSHDSPTYGSPFDMLKRFGISFQTAGENIACNQTVERAHAALMNSQGHRENILNSSYTHIGIGIVNGGQCGKMFTQQFVGR
ncbi:peptidoglycan-binding protein [Paenibacillus sp. y28]|uniref:peptidoglycan-binding protein n=1 Tax=Paenibacillus sp. y28 TaxID=3129110 RepID=UPI0030176D09